MQEQGTHLRSVLIMKTAVVVLALFGACFAQIRTLQPSELRRPIAIVSQSSEQSIDGSFTYGFQSENGIQSSASGSVRALSPTEQAQVVEGSFSYVAPDGTPISRRYVADENGFHVEGADLPTPPPVPLAIARSLELLPRLEQQERRA